MKLRKIINVLIKTIKIIYLNKNIKFKELFYENLCIFEKNK